MTARSISCDGKGCTEQWPPPKKFPLVHTDPGVTRRPTANDFPRGDEHEQPGVSDNHAGRLRVTLMNPLRAIWNWLTK